MPESSADANSTSLPASDSAAAASRESLGLQIHAELRDLSSALAALFDALPAPIRKASDLSRLLDMEISLAARIYRVARAAAPAEAIESLPTTNQLRRVVERACALTSGPAATHAAETLARFERLMDEVGDQREFESVASMHLPGGVRRVELAHRRTAFRANSHLWGRTVDSFSSIVVLVPSKDGDSFDAAYNFGYIKARLLHPRQRFEFSVRTMFAGTDEAEARRRHMEVLPEFSDIRGASLTHRKGGEGFTISEIELQGERATTPLTLFTRQLLPGFARRSQPERCHNGCFITWPAARLHIEVAMPVGLSDPSRVAIEAFANPKVPQVAMDSRPEDLAPLHETPQAFLDVESAPSPPGLPVVPEVFRASVKWLGLEGSRFDIYRCDVEYPMLHSYIRLRMPLRASAAI